jgi:hypothetical protein
MDGIVHGPRPNSTEHLAPRPPTGMARDPGVQRGAPAALPPLPRPSGRRLRASPVHPWRGWPARARVGGAAPRYSRPHWHVLMRSRRAGRDASESGNMWQLLANLINCEEAAFNQTLHSSPRPSHRPPPLVGRTLLDGPTTTLAAWHCGPSLPAWARGLLDVVAYHRQTSVHLDS